MRAWFAILFGLCFVPLAHAALKTEEVRYAADGVSLHGYLAYDSRIQGKRPGVLVVHEWWGHNAYARKRAEMLAAMGYTALAVDMYGEGKQADHPEDAKKFMQAVANQLPVARARFEAAMQALKAHPTVDAKAIAAIGYCFGGAVVLNMARLGLPLRGVISYHGSLASTIPVEPGQIRARVAVFTGAADPMIPGEQIDAFNAEMRRAGVTHSVTVYAGVKHSFTNPEADEYGRRFNMPLAYDAAADRDSWAQTAALLKEWFSDKP